MSTTSLVRVEPRSRFLRLMDAIRSSWSGPLTLKSPELARLWAGPPSSSGVAVNEQTALNYSAVWSAVSLIAADVASLPLILYKRLPKGGKERFVGHPLYRLLHDEPNPEMTSMVFRETLQAHVLTWGNGYAEIERDVLGRPLALWPLLPSAVCPYRDTPMGPLEYRVQNPSGTTVTIPARDMLHVPGLGWDGTCGYSVIAKARESIGLGLATERFGGSFFGNGSTFGGILSHPLRLSDKAKENLSRAMEKRHQGVERAHRLMILEEGITYTQMGVPAKDAQFLETRKFQITEIARWFNIPPHKLRDLERATFSNIEQQNIEYYTDTLRPWLIRWEQEINRKLIAPLERNLQFAEHRIEGLLRGDIQSRYAAYAIGRQWGWLTANMIAELENLNPFGPQGDILLVPMNMTPADRIQEVIDAQIKPKTAPPQPDEGTPAQDNPAARLAAMEAELRAARAEAATAHAEARAEQATLEETLRTTATTAIERALLTHTKEAAETRALEATRHAESLATQVSILRELQAQIAATVERVDALPQAVTEGVREPSAAQADALAREAARAERETAAAAAARAAQDAAERRAADAEQAREAAAVQVATAQADQQAATQIAAEARATISATEVRLAEALARVAETEARAATEVERHRVAAEDARQAAEAALETQRQAEAARMASVIAAHRALIVDAMGRFVRRGTEKARKHQATPEKLRRWIEAFGATEEDIGVEMLLPSIRVHVTWLASAKDPAVVARSLAREYLADLSRQIRLVADEEQDERSVMLERVLTRLEEDRPAFVADQLLHEEIDHVRNPH